LPVLEITSTRTAGSPAMRSMASESSAISASSKALWRSGPVEGDDADAEVDFGNDVGIHGRSGYMRKTPNLVGWMGALSEAEMPKPSVRRVCTGSTMPSSHRRAVA
jgi:hypothetical protein